ncbi:Notchless protein-like protein [Raphanus sativus]|uniref:Notchless protein homolog n=1 Tax=Raphanus sativus TaxID=3726 RepID=A0A6J0N883_RAPSA|nr:notchless protein homolog [Raphanus sativus]KAJ4900031.1 Notchless protein-like protein [Raphanus sativus]
METGTTVLCRLVDAEGTPLGDPMYIPRQAGPVQLTELANRFLNNEEKLNYAFYVSGEALSVPVGTYIENRSVSVEEILTIQYREEAVFRTRPVSRISASIADHRDSVLCVSFSPDGTQLASGSGDTTVRLWDIYTQTPMFTCRGHTNWVMSVAWSPDGKHLVSGDLAGNICFWIPKTGMLDGRPVRGHRKWITSISWEPVHLTYPCRRFVTSSKDEDARIWDMTLKKSVTCLSGHTRGVTCVKWGGDGIIYTGSQDCTIKMWHVTPEGVACLKGKLKEHGHWVNSLALSTDYVLRTGAFDHTGKLYSSSSPEEVRKAALKRYDQAKGEYGERLVSGSDDFTMILWDPSVSDQFKKKLSGHQKLVNHVCFSPNGQWIASASFDNSVKIWDGITGDFITTFRGHIGPVYQISWSPDSRMLLSCSKDTTLKIWDIKLRRLEKDLPGHTDEVYAVDWSPDGEKVVSGGKDTSLKLWVG